MGQYDFYKSILNEINAIKRAGYPDLTFLNRFPEYHNIISSIDSPLFKATELAMANLESNKTFSIASELARSANFSLMETIGKISLGNDIAREIAQTMNSFTISHIEISSLLARSIESTTLAAYTLSRIPGERFGSALNFSLIDRDNLSASFLDFSHSYKSLINSFEGAKLSDMFRSPIFCELPSIEFLKNTDLIEVISIEGEEGELEVEKQRVTSEISIETGQRLEELLKSLDPSYINIYQGAREAFNSNNPDRNRHICISCRELCTQILREVAPDEEIHKWSTSPSDFYKDRPTRAARLRYLYRNINHAPLCKFIDKDIDAVMALLELFNRGTHEVDACYTPTQMEALMLRAKSFILFILEISKTNS